MPLPRLNVHRHDDTNRTLITLSGEIDLATAPLVRAALAERLNDGTGITDVDLTGVTFCDASGLNVFLTASGLATEAGMILRLHHPPPIMARIIEITGSGFLVHELPTGPTPPSGRSPEEVHSRAVR